MRTLIFVISILVLSSVLTAETTTPVEGDYGIGGSVSSTINTIDYFYNISDSIIINPTIGFYFNNIAITPIGGSTINSPDTLIILGIGLYYVIVPFDNLSVRAGPTIGFMSESYSKGDSYQLNSLYLGLKLNFLAMINKNLGVFTVMGIHYYLEDAKDTVSSFDSLMTSFGLDTSALGVAYYFK